jgi:hypothetical protein
LAVKSSAVFGMSLSSIKFWTGVATGLGVTVLIEGHARPRSPSPVPCWNSVERLFASSIAWFAIVSPPSDTLSVPTVPEAEEPSPYEIFQVEPLDVLKVEDLLESKMVCPLLWLWVAFGSSVDQTCKSSQ